MTNELYILSTKQVVGMDIQFLQLKDGNRMGMVVEENGLMYGALSLKTKGLLKMLLVEYMELFLLK